MCDRRFNPKLLHHVRQFPGDESFWDLMSLYVFKYTLPCGLTESTRLLDVGCGSLRVGRHLITFLAPGKYTGLEPEAAMVTRGLSEPPLCPQLLAYKRPTFVHNPNFDITGQYDMALATQVFFHCSERQLCECLEKIGPRLRGPFILEVLIKDICAIHRKPDQQDGFQYRYADYDWIEYTEDSFVTIVRHCGFDPQHLGDCFWRLEKTS